MKPALLRLLVVGFAAGAAALGAAGCGSSSNTSTVVVSGGAVKVIVTAPTSGSVIDSDSVTVRGTVTPANATVQVAGKPAAVGNGIFTGTASLHGGKTTIDVIGSAPGAAPGSTSIVVVRPGAPGQAKQNSGGSGGGGTTGSNVANEHPASGGQSSCGGGLSVGPNTTCDFARNVQAVYNGPGTYNVYSPVTGQSYAMTCNSDNAGVVCTGGNNASVYFP